MDEFDWPVFVGLTVAIIGGAGYFTGQALARGWRPAWQVVLYAALLGLADRFLHYALFDGVLLSLSGYLVGTAVTCALGLLAYRLARVRAMVAQYPWLYERAGPFAWREKDGG